MKKLIYITFLLGLSFSYAQTKSERAKIIEKTDVVTLSQLQNQFNSEFLSRKTRIENYLKNNTGVQLKTSLNGVEKEIYDITESGEILYYTTSNLESSVTANANKLYNGGSMGLNVQGQNMIAGVWDSGPVRDTHVEFPNFKVAPFDFAPSFSNHGTHVMGTILAAGTNSNARGIAFQAEGYTYDWTNDYAEMTNAAASGLLVSNHSYSKGGNQLTWILGAYDTHSQQMDQLTFAAPFYLPVVSAGNDRNSNESTTISSHNQNKFGYDLIKGMGNSKNALTVGAVNNVPFYVDEASVVMSNFSSWGPTDDGRIKPEIVAKGVGVFSPIASSDTNYSVYQGTSMSSPAVAGVCLLLQQHYNNLFASYMRSATLKGLVLHTAREAGLSIGPDYEFGWGLIDAEGAANAITAKNNTTGLIEELTLANGSTYSRDLTISNLSNLKVSISWTDRAAPTSVVNNGAIDPTDSYLVNDLDLKITKNGTDYFPWTLSKSSPFNPAINTVVNNIDIFERVDINNAVGSYTITVSHKGTLVGNSQNFTLIVTGQNLVLSNDEFKNQGFSIYPNPTNNLLFVESEFDLINPKIKISDISGKTVYSANDLNNNSIDVSSLSNGFYILEIVNDNKTFTKKFIKN